MLNNGDFTPHMVGYVLKTKMNFDTVRTVKLTRDVRDTQIIDTTEFVYRQWRKD